MRRVTALFPYQARAWRRGVAGDRLSAMNLFVLVVAFVTCAPQWIEWCAGGDVARALFAIFLVWIVLPGLVREMQLSHPGVAAVKLLRLPFSRAELFAAAALGSFAHPAVVALFVLTWVVLRPLGAAAGVLFVIACVTLSWTVVPAATLVFRTRIGLLAGTLVAIGVAAAGRPWLPPSLAGRAAGGDAFALAALATWSVAALVAGPFLLDALLHEPPARGERRRKTRPFVGFPGAPRPVGVAAAKELRILCRTVDALVAGGIAVLGAGYVLVAQPAPALLALIPGLVVLTQAGAPLNAFGLDRAGIDRYRLLPLRPTEMLVSKNLAFGALLLLQLLPLVVVAGWRFGALAAAALLFGIVAYGAAALVVGNFASARATAPREFHGVESIDQSGGLLPTLVLLAAWLPPAALAGAVAPRGGLAIAGAELLLAALFAAVYARTVRRLGLALETRFDRLRERVAA